jgi:hypothetical protein
MATIDHTPMSGATTGAATIDVEAAKLSPDATTFDHESLCGATATMGRDDSSLKSEEHVQFQEMSRGRQWFALMLFVTSLFIDGTCSMLELSSSSTSPILITPQSSALLLSSSSPYLSPMTSESSLSSKHGLS